YRQIAGYLVRPLHPLIAWLLFVAAFAIYRLSRRKDLLNYPWSHPKNRWLKRGGAVGAASIRGLNEFAEGLTSVGPPRPADAGKHKSSVLGANISRVRVP